MNVFAANSVVWPLCFLLVALLIMRQLREDVRPIFRGIVVGLASQAQSNAMAWAVGLAMATLGSMTAAIDVAHANGWINVESALKIATPFIATLVTLSMKSPIKDVSAPSPSAIIPPGPSKTTLTVETPNP